MRRLTTGVLVACLLVLAAGSTAAQTPPPGPPYPDAIDGVRVYDYAGVLADKTIESVETTIAGIEDRTGAEIAVYTQVKPESDTPGHAQRDAAALIDQWGIGRAGIDDGLAILFDLEPNLCHAQVQLYAGPGYHARYLDSEARQDIFENEMLPALQECDFDTALLQAMEHIDLAHVATPPWFGGRIEMPEHGFAATIPDGWVGLDLTIDVGRQLDVAFDQGGWEHWGVDGAYIRNDDTDRVAQLEIFDTSSASFCSLDVRRAIGISAADLAEAILDRDTADPGLADVRLTRRIELPAGLASSVEATILERAGADSEVTSYVVGDGEWLAIIVCVALAGERPEDDWLSIVETFEFLSQELESTLGAFGPTGSLAEARGGHTATLLLDGRVLVIGGTTDGAEVLASAEVWDPATGTFSPTDGLTEPRALHSATLLPDDRVLVVGGTRGGGDTLASAEVWDPTTGAFSPVGPLAEERALHTATLLPDGSVLVVGGTSDDVAVLASTELWEPVSGRFGRAGALAEAHSVHTATLLPEGRVLIVGGFAQDHLPSAEIWDPSTGEFSSAGSPGDERFLHTATLLPDGRALVVGGGSSEGVLESAEIREATTEAFEPTGSLAEPRHNHTATLLPDGRVLVVGGDGGDVLNVSSSAEVWDPATGSFAPTDPLAEARSAHTATLLPDGRVLIVGGGGNLEVLASAELWDPGELAAG